ncbi:antitoxin [Pasteurella testudinis]|uniref:antitoxin n=1 Tax=Pasteurella testudinis TaxID=761 RepID=UPI0040597C0F
MATARLFWTGNSQALRLPKAFRFEGEKVKISRSGKKVIIEPIISDWAWLDELGDFDSSFEQAVQESKATVLGQKRDWDFFE